MDDKNPIIPDGLQKTVDTANRITKSVQPILDAHNELSKLTEQANSVMPIVASNPAIDAIKENMPNKLIRNLGEIGMASVVPDFNFTSPILQSIKETANSAVSNLSSALTAFVDSEAVKTASQINTTIGMWLQNIDFSPLKGIINYLANLGFEVSQYYKKLNEKYLQAMFDSKWFPYTGGNADVSLLAEISEILSSSRASKNRVNRIDAAIFNYYSKEELMNLKRKWREKGLPSYMQRIMIQAVQAYNRREYALTVSSLSTLWEGIIAEKANDSNDFRVGQRTKDNLKKLVDDNKFASVFSSFCDEYIFYNCQKKEDVKEDVPGRHSIAHCWYDSYPNRKAALNSIIFTDFLIDIKPLEK